jgi:1,4-alpha-glucan branching enzyme
VSARRAHRGELALVLHTHMPYVEGFGTWPFGEEWLWEAMASCYLPLLAVLERGAPITLSLTPVLCDQLEAPGVADRFAAFLRDVRAATHRLDIEGCRDSGAHELVGELERSAADYERAEASFAAVGDDLLGALSPHATWTSSATHAVLPLLATAVGIELQVRTGIAAGRRRLPGWDGGFWLPECAFAPGLQDALVAAGARTVCVDLTDVHGLGSVEALAPLVGRSGLLVVPIDRATMELVWSDDGYPAHGAYRDYHHHTIHHHRPWGNDGRVYDREAAAHRVRQHAREFVSAVIARLDSACEATGRPGLCVCPLDTELLGHWWFEGIQWLAAVLDEAAVQGLAVARLDDALASHEPVAVPDDQLPVSSWGSPRTLATWDNPAVADLAWQARAGELAAVAAGEGAGERALRELLALQASDWAFMASRGLAGDYARERAEGHARELDRALRSLGSAPPSLRNLAPVLEPAGLTSP